MCGSHYLFVRAMVSRLLLLAFVAFGWPGSVGLVMGCDLRYDRFVSFFSLGLLLLVPFVFLYILSLSILTAVFSL